MGTRYCRARAQTLLLPARVLVAPAPRTKACVPGCMVEQRVGPPMHAPACQARPGRAGHPAHRGSPGPPPGPPSGGADCSGAPACDGGLQVDVPGPAGHSVVSTQLLLPVRGSYGLSWQGQACRFRAPQGGPVQGGCCSWQGGCRPPPSAWGAGRAEAVRRAPLDRRSRPTRLCCLPAPVAPLPGAATWLPSWNWTMAAPRTSR